MAITLTPISESDAVVLTLTGKIDKSEYHSFALILHEAIKQHGKIRLLVVMENFTGLQLGALWEELKFGVQHSNDFSRMAFVGDKKWEENLVELSKPFIGAVIKYFELPNVEEARRWLLSDEPSETEAEVRAAMSTPY